MAEVGKIQIGTVDNRRVALESVGLAIASLGGYYPGDEEFERVVMPRAERIRRWVLVVGTPECSPRDAD